jgi:hypothetical protein
VAVGNPARVLEPSDEGPDASAGGSG